MENNINNLEKLTKIAASAALSIKGVNSLVNVPINFTIMAKEYSKGVTMSVANDGLVFDIYLNVDIGANIPQVSFKVQEIVKKTIEKICNKTVSKINIHIQGISIK